MFNTLVKVVTWVPKDTYINLLDSTSYKFKCNETTLIFNIISQLSQLKIF